MKEIPILEFRNINKSFKDKTVLKDLDLSVYSKDILALAGKSGSGKSTLMKVMIGFYKPDSGSIIYKGKNITDNVNELRKVVGFTTQENSFYENLTLIENLRYYAKLYDIHKKDLNSYLSSILKSVELYNSKDVLAGKVSGGMKRRLDFAISLVHEPDILVLDEPTTGLDPLLVKSFWDIIKKFRDKGKTIIVTSHIFEELDENCKRICVLDKGSFTEVGEIDKIKSKYNAAKLSEAFEKIVSK